MQPLKPSAAPMWECRKGPLLSAHSPNPQNLPRGARRAHTADCAAFLWRNGKGMWNASSLPHLQQYLKTSGVYRLHDDAEDLQLTLALGTADKLQQVLVGYVSQPWEVL